MPPSKPESEGRAAQGRVLLVEDDPEAALFAGFVLGTRGRFEVVCTADPAAALAMAATEPWDLLLTDLDLPVMSGLELLAALRAFAPRLPVAVLTALPAGIPPAAALAAVRPDAILVKPVKAGLLLGTAIRLTTAGPAGGRAGGPLAVNDDSPRGHEFLQ